MCCNAQSTQTEQRCLQPVPAQVACMRTAATCPHVSLSQVHHPPGGDADRLGAADKLPQAIAGHNQDVLVPANGGVRGRHSGRVCAALRRRPPPMLLPASMLRLLALAAATAAAATAASLALLRRSTGRHMLLLLLGVGVGVPAVRRTVRAAPAAPAAVAAVAVLYPLLPATSGEHHCHHIRGAGHTGGGRHIVTKAAADGQARHVCLPKVHSVRPSWLAGLINHGLHDPAAGCLDAGALQRAARGKIGGRSGRVGAGKGRAGGGCKSRANARITRQLAATSKRCSGCIAAQHLGPRAGAWWLHCLPSPASPVRCRPLQRPLLAHLEGLWSEVRAQAM